MTHRELNTLIAEKVLLQVWPEHRCRVCGWTLGSEEALGCTAESCSMRPRPERRADEPALFSTNIADAWQIVETLSARGYQFELSELSGGWAAEFDADLVPGVVPGVAIDGRCEDICPTAPVAICLAALAAYGIAIDPADIADPVASLPAPREPKWDDKQSVCCLHDGERAVALLRNVNGHWFAYDATRLNEARDGMREIGSFMSVAAAKRAAESELLIRG